MLELFKKYLSLQSICVECSAAQICTGLPYLLQFALTHTCALSESDCLVPLYVHCLRSG